MKKSWRWFLGTAMVAVIGLPLVLTVAVYAAINDRPMVTGMPTLTTEQIERANQLLGRTGPRTLRPGERYTVAVSQEDLNLAVNYLADRLGKGGASVVLQDGSAKVRVSVMLQRSLSGSFLNIEADLRETQTLPRFDHLRIGRLPVPAFLANRLLDMGLNKLHSKADLSAIAAAIKQVSVRRDQLSVVYEWSNDVQNQLQVVLVPRHEPARIKTYQAHLAELTQGTTAGGGRPLLTLVQTLF
jgi:hypothetical protein